GVAAVQRAGPAPLGAAAAEPGRQAQRVPPHRLFVRCSTLVRRPWNLALDGGGRTMIDPFWAATGELPCESLNAAFPEWYRLHISPSHQWEERRVFRMQRPSLQSKAGAQFIAHYLSFAKDYKTVAAQTYEMALTSAHWHGLEALLALAHFWELGEN